MTNYEIYKHAKSKLDIEVDGFDSDDEVCFSIEYWDERFSFWLPRAEIRKLHEALGKELEYE